MTQAYLIPYDSWDFSTPIFAFDVQTSEQREDSWTWSQYALESGSEVSDHAVEQPRTYSLSGIVTAALAESEDEVYTRCSDMHAALVEYARTRQPVTLVCGLWADEVVIEKVSAKRGQDTGDAVEIEVSLRSFAVVEYRTEEIPPELLSPPAKKKAQAEPAAVKGEAADEQLVAADEQSATDTRSPAAIVFDAGVDGFSSALDPFRTTEVEAS
jgi:hypothetical protein